MGFIEDTEVSLCTGIILLIVLNMGTLIKSCTDNHLLGLEDIDHHKYFFAVTRVTRVNYFLCKHIKKFVSFKNLHF